MKIMVLSWPRYKLVHPFGKLFAKELLNVNLQLSNAPVILPQVYTQAKKKCMSTRRHVQNYLGNNPNVN